jgi:cytochrome c oxidase assembly protein subunit 15
LLACHHAGSLQYVTTRFQKISIAATLATFLLIGVGGFVRAAGAGLGCPDWPRCFDRWVPPIDITQLPPHIDPAQFNFTLAWIEYANRMVGVTVGFLILAVGIVAWQMHRKRPRILWPAIGCVLLVAFQGWFGGQVVAYELDPRFVTVHLVLALVLLALLLHLVVAGFDEDTSPQSLRLPRPTPEHSVVWRLSVATIILVLLQTLLGALVRGSLEILFHARPELLRGEAFDQLGAIGTVHKATGVVTLLLCAALFTAAQIRLEGESGLRRWAQLPIWVAIAQFAVGLGLASRALPPSLQLAHLLGGSLLFGSLAVTTLLLAPYRRQVVAPMPGTTT